MMPTAHSVYEVILKPEKWIRRIFLICSCSELYAIDVYGYTHFVMLLIQYSEVNIRNHNVCGLFVFFFLFQLLKLYNVLTFCSVVDFYEVFLWIVVNCSGDKFIDCRWRRTLVEANQVKEKKTRRSVHRPFFSNVVHPCREQRHSEGIKKLNLYVPNKQNHDIQYSLRKNHRDIWSRQSSHRSGVKFANTKILSVK